MAARKAARVLPDPVGAKTSADLPPTSAGQALAWAGVGSGKVASNQRRTGGWKAARASFGATGAGGLLTLGEGTGSVYEPISPFEPDIERWTRPQQADRVPQRLSGSGLAGRRDTPVVLTSRGTLDL